MSKAKRLREMQEEISELKQELEETKKQLTEYRKRDKPIIGDFRKVK